MREKVINQNEPVLSLADVSELNRTNHDEQEEMPERPFIDVGCQPLELLNQAWDILLAQNEPPRLFQRNNILVEINTQTNHGVNTLHSLSRYDLCQLLIHSCDWMYGSRNARPTDWLLRMMLCKPDSRLPELESIITSPVLGRSGTLIDTPGYHPQEKTYLLSKDLHPLAPIPDIPTSADIGRARTLLLEEMLGDFPFVTSADKAHAVCAMLLPFIRIALGQACTPLHVIESPSPGSGKGLLANVISLIATASPCVAMTLGQSEGETRKKLTSLLAESARIVLIDNLDQNRIFSSPTLASILTTPTWTDRLLGHTKMTTHPNQALWIMTGNNPRLSMELARRSIRIRLDSKIDQPWLRNTFRHPNLLQWVQENRLQLVHACLILIQAGIVDKRRQFPDKKLGSFETWSALMDHLLKSVGISGFLENLDDHYAAADAEHEVWRCFVRHWWATYQATPVRVSDLHGICIREELLLDILGNGSDRSQQSRLGRALNTRLDMVFGHLRLARDTSAIRNSTRYILENLEER